jgi:CRP/FNR family transcriptional regulator, nitrogen oxide reductase regulator
MSASGLATLDAGIKSQFLDGFSVHDLNLILAAATRRHILADSVVVGQGEPADRLFLLTKGRCRFFFDTQDGRKIVLLWLTPGEIFGGRALLSTPSTYLVGTETLKDSCLLVWDRITIRKLATQYPRLLENGLNTASDYLAWYLAGYEALVSHTAPERLARVLICLAETIGKRVPEGFEIEATNEELASAANVTHFTASRLMSAWQRNHTLTKRRGNVLVRFPERLLLNIV